jgi:hypothetical protein
MRAASVVSILLLALPVMCLADAASKPTTAPITRDTPDQQIVQLIDRATQAKDLKEMQQIHRTVDALFKDNDPDRFVRLSHALANRLSTFEFGGTQQYRIASAVALDALQHCTAQTDLVIQLDLASRLRPQVLTDVHADQAPLLRKEYLASWSKAFARLEAAATAPFDPAERLNLNRLPARLQNAVPVSGMPSSTIKDPELRKEYEAALRERDIRARQYIERYFARRRRSRYLFALTNFTTTLYTGQQRAKVEKELNEFLSAANLSPADKQRIIARIEFATN